jgi:hypothetical protein
MAAITVSLVYAGRNRLRYLLTAAGAGPDTATLTTTGAATPDLLTDLGTNGGALMAIVKAFTAGYGSFAAGALVQAQARALYLSDFTSANPGAPSGKGSSVPTAECKLTGRTTGQTALIVDANVDGSGHPTLGLTMTGGGTAYLDIEIPGTIGA